MSSSSMTSEKDITSAVISLLGKKDPPPTYTEIKKATELCAELNRYDGKIENIIADVQVAIETRVGRGVSIIDVEATHDSEWIEKRDDIKWTYSNAYERFLTQEGWAPDAALATKEVSNKILGHLQDPLCPGSWSRRGLVIGHVQSGKTANYLGLLTRAADAGYKFIIVIAGIHNNLRTQTQERVELGFIGRSSSPNNRSCIGVAEFTPDYPHPITLTSTEKDFNKSTATARFQILDTSKPIVLVIKKNVSTLKSLHSWLKNLNAKSGTIISDVPMLMIDDEADNASINTNKEDTNPTRTNEWLRKILALFAKSCYVGYTATPFANIFINPDGYDKDTRKDLFPEDFIYLLDAPNTYFGPQKIFIDDAGTEKFLRNITDCEEYIPLSHNKDFNVFALAPSLKKAFNAFIVAKAIRNYRGQQNKHCSMLINVSRIVSVQKDVKRLLMLHKRAVYDAVVANYQMSEDFSSKNPYMIALREAYNLEFSSCSVTWEDVKKNLLSAFDTLKLLAVNSKSDDILEYKRYEQEGRGLTAIAIGGFTLSRGLTLEGLCISYMYRNTRMYDTLMQMGRWFGYRNGYEDLCRIYLHADAIDWYGFIAEKTEELRQQIYIMRQKGLTPKDFGLYIERHPDRLLITAANKMRSAVITPVRQSYSGKLVETYFLPIASNIRIENEKLIQHFAQHIVKDKLEKVQKGWFAKNINYEDIIAFLHEYQFYREQEQTKQAVIKYLEEISDLFPSVDVLFISVKNNEEDEQSFRMGYQERKATNIGEAWKTPKGRVASRGDEKMGLSKDQLQQAAEWAQKLYAAGSSKSEEPSDVHYRSVRNKPLLMLHTVQIKDGVRVPALGISFPFTNIGKTITVAANQIWKDSMNDDIGEDFDDEDD